MRSYPLLTVGLLLLGVAPASAQPKDVASRRPVGMPAPKEGRYVTFRFDQNVGGLIHDKLHNLEHLEQYKKIVEGWLSVHNKNKLNVDPGLLKKLNLENPDVQKRLVDLAKQQAKAKAPEEIKKIGADLKKLMDEQPKEKPPEAPKADADALPDAKEPPDQDTGARDWLKDVMERSQESQLGDWLRDSPAWQQALEDLHTSLRKPPAMRQQSWGLDKLVERLGKLDKLPMPDAKFLERLGNLKPPNLPRWTPTLPSLSPPNLPAVAPPPMPSASGLGTLAAWLLALGLVAVLGWQAARLLTPARASARSAAAELGPWPLDPQLVATRTELVQAFDYLALLVLGVQARSWHHHAIARAFAQRAASLAVAAGELTALYEQARYTEGAEALPADERNRARLTLIQLAGVVLA